MPKEGINNCPVCKSGYIFRTLETDPNIVGINCGSCGLNLGGSIVSDRDKEFEELKEKWNKLGTLNIKSKSQARRLSAQL